MRMGKKYSTHLRARGMPIQQTSSRIVQFEYNNAKAGSATNRTPLFTMMLVSYPDPHGPHDA